MQSNDNNNSLEYSSTLNSLEARSSPSLNNQDEHSNTIELVALEANQANTTRTQMLIDSLRHTCDIHVTTRMIELT
jgi:hypothetical protein